MGSLLSLIEVFDFRLGRKDVCVWGPSPSVIFNELVACECVQQLGRNLFYGKVTSLMASLKWALKSWNRDVYGGY